MDWEELHVMPPFGYIILTLVRPHMDTTCGVRIALFAFITGPENYKGWLIPLKFTICRHVGRKPVFDVTRLTEWGPRVSTGDSFILLFVPVLSSVTCYFVEIL
ncbi:hypothetical protein AVEN_3391-1 [Araneus ventricosus]|uniref:Uncharacterized protein n=1 Tax=Araneus ventricosus TaxID=182803 RepID=A0A4Y2NHC5_ARAVE|nr:hypothetical protein AVEN_3391-1 [Araneus ventricosus]